MNKTAEGVLYPFHLKASRMRQGAVTLRRQGQVLDALSLLRRAAEQEDTPAAWLTVAAELRQLGCWEAAARLTSRALAAPTVPPGAWVEMARCMQALGNQAMATDCLYHQLHEDPWSPEGDAARELLMDLEGVEEEPKEPRRISQLVHRGLTAWTGGNRALGERRIRRALRISADRQRLLSTAAMLCMLDFDVRSALGYLGRAYRRDPLDARTLVALSTLVYQQERPRMARGFLEKAAPLCFSVAEEDGFLAAAWAQDAWPQMARFLQMRMKACPHRIPLLAAKAIMHNETGDISSAQQCWREILAIDPDDRQAAAQLGAMRTGEPTRLLPPGGIPLGEKRRQNQELRLLMESGEPISALMQRGSRGRRLVEWHLASPDQEETRLVRGLLGKRSDPEVAACLRETVAQPFLSLDVRQWALLRLADMGCLDEMLMPTGEHYNTVQCQRISERKQRSPWLLFLPSLLSETRQYRQSRQIAEFAASIWKRLSPAQQTEAAGSGRYAWCKAMEVLYLRANGQAALSAHIAQNTALSRRKISRVLRRIARSAHIE